MSERVSGGGGEEDGGKEGRTDAGGMAANKTRTPHRDVGNKNRWRKRCTAAAVHVAPQDLQVGQG